MTDDHDPIQDDLEPAIHRALNEARDLMVVRPRPGEKPSICVDYGVANTDGVSMGLHVEMTEEPGVYRVTDRGEAARALWMDGVQRGNESKIRLLSESYGLTIDDGWLRAYDDVDEQGLPQAMMRVLAYTIAVDGLHRVAREARERRYREAMKEAEAQR